MILIPEAALVSYLLGLLRDPRQWVLRRVVTVELLDTETAKIETSLDIDLGKVEDKDVRGYLSSLDAHSRLLIPLGLRQKGVTAFHATDFEGRHLSLLTRPESKDLEQALLREVERQLSRPESYSSIVTAQNQKIKSLLTEVVKDVGSDDRSQDGPPDILTFLEIPRDYLARHDLRYQYRGPSASHTGPSARVYGG